ncbi:LamG-like jellyroll fold domain-containing protein, partial [Candidatus Poribacteria bacterium]
MIVRRFLPLGLRSGAALSLLPGIIALVCIQNSSAALENIIEPSDAWPGNTDQIQFLWENSRAHNEVFDEENQQHRLFRGLLYGRARYGPHYQLELGRGYFRPDDVDDSLLRACKKSNQLAIEAVIHTRNLKQSGPARIISFSSGSGSRNFTLGQDKDKLILRLRTPKTGTNGTGPEFTLCTVKAGYTHHILLTYRPGSLIAYLDGKQVFSSEKDRGNFSNWEPQHLVFGDEHGGERDWAGSLEGVAIYSRFIPEAEAKRHYKLYARRLEDRKSPDRLVIEANLIEKTETPPIDRLGTYRRCLAEYVYEVKKVVKGNLESKKIVVAHWVIMDMKVLPEKRSKNTTYRLSIEPWEQHPQLQSELIETYMGEFGLPVFYDASLSVAKGSATPEKPSIHLRVNAGGPAIGKPGNPDYWESDSKYVSGGRSYPFKGKHDVSKAKKPAPQQVYQTVRHEDHRYNFSKLPNGKYTVRFHFTDGYEGHSRAMDYTVDGIKVIDDFSIYKAAGGTMKAVVVEATVMISDNNGLQIVCKKDRGSDVFEAGIEVISGGGELTQAKVVKPKESSGFG